MSEIKQRGPMAASSIATAGALCMAVMSCGGDMGSAKSAQDARVRRPTEIVLERCAVDGDGVEKFDADGDGRAEVTKHVEGGREVCRVADLNFDGKADRTSYFDESGKLRRVETDFDRDGRVDEVAIYSAGTLTQRDRATSLSGKLDTWEFYEQAKLVRTERDENGDGVVDQWWEYPTAQCPLIHSDTDGDGRPDPAATIDYCKTTGYVPPPVKEETDAGTGPDFTPPERVNETSNVSADEAAAGTGGATGSGGSASRPAGTANSGSGGKPSGTGGSAASGSGGKSSGGGKSPGTGGAASGSGGKSPGAGGSATTGTGGGTGGSQ